MSKNMMKMDMKTGKAHDSKMIANNVDQERTPGMISKNLCCLIYVYYRGKRR